MGDFSSLDTGNEKRSKVYIHTFGCQMNEYDSERLAQLLLAHGWTMVQDSHQADLLLVNTCTVRQLAEEKAFSLIGRWAKLKSERPHIMIGMVGCLAQYLGNAAFQRAPALDFLAGPRALTRVPELVENARQKKRVAELSICDFGPGADAPPGIVPSAYVAVMDGCNQFCTYCAVPRARGRENSRLPEDILAEIRRRVKAGTKEITLLGQNITRYGFDLKNGENLADLLYRIADAVPDLPRLRFLTGHPQAFTERLIKAMQDIPMVCEALHLPLQSGSDTVLRNMRRGYTAAEYLDLVQNLRSAIPDLTLSTDLIVGFPGEREVDFQATLDMVQKCEFDLAFCFKYSPRKDTVAALLPDQLPQSVKKERLAALLQLIEGRAIKKKNELVGQRVQVLIEGTDRKTQKRLQGRTRGNHIVNLDGPREWIGHEIEVEIIAAGHWSLLGEAVAANESKQAG